MHYLCCFTELKYCAITLYPGESLMGFYYHDCYYYYTFFFFVLKIKNFYYLLRQLHWPRTQCCMWPRAMLHHYFRKIKYTRLNWALAFFSFLLPVWLQIGRLWANLYVSLYKVWNNSRETVEWFWSNFMMVVINLSGIFDRLRLNALPCDHYCIASKRYTSTRV